nr:hypothetical protein Iba_chr06dCG8840 [Ipomoea batatas]
MAESRLAVAGGRERRSRLAVAGGRGRRLWRTSQRAGGRFLQTTVRRALWRAVAAAVEGGGCSCGGRWLWLELSVSFGGAFDFGCNGAEKVTTRWMAFYWSRQPIVSFSVEEATQSGRAVVNIFRQ